MRDRLPQRRLPRHSRSPGVPFDEERAHDAQRGRARARRATASPGAGRLLRRLDQAWADRDHRHEQEGRRRDGRAPARGRRAAGALRDGRASAERRRRAARGARLSASSPTRAGRRSTRSSASRGEPQGRPRVKLVTWDELLATALAARYLAAGLGSIDSAAWQRRPTQQELWGAETRKAVANFPVSGEPIPVPVARWLARIKAASARVNAELGLLDAEQGGAHRRRRRPRRRRRVRRPVPDRRLPDRVRHVVEHERERGDRGLAGDGIHPNDHVNMGQSSNDVFPSAVHLAALDEIDARPPAGAAPARATRSPRRRPSSTTSSSRAART